MLIAADPASRQAHGAGPRVRLVPVFASPAYQIDYVPAPQPAAPLVVTFTERTHRSLAGLGFAGKFAVDNGFALLAFKSNVDRWYQDLPDAALTAAERFLAALPVPPARRAGYGSSMGAYAAVAFSGRLSLDDVLAISPQVDITQPWDTRWADEAAAIGAMRAIDAAMIRPGCRYVIAYDPLDQDRLHYEHIARLVAPGRLVALRVPAFGHPAGYFLQQSGVLKTVARAVLAGAPLPAVGPALRGARRGNAGYLFTLAGLCMDRGKLRAARALAGQTLALAPLEAEYNIRAAQIAERLGHADEALARAAVAAAIWPFNGHILAVLARILAGTGHPRQAAFYLRAALAGDPGNTVFRDMLDAAEAQG